MPLKRLDKKIKNQIFLIKFLKDFKYIICVFKCVQVNIQCIYPTVPVCIGR